MNRGPLITAVLSCAALLFSQQTTASQDLRTVIAPSCLLENTSVVYDSLATTASYSLIQADASQLEELMMQAHQQVAPCGQYMDVTYEWQHQHSKLATHDAALEFLSIQNSIPSSDGGPYSIKHAKTAKKLLSELNHDNYWHQLEIITDTRDDHFPDRSAYSETGAKMTAWLIETLTNYANQYHRKDISISSIPSKRYCRNCKQDSVLLTIGPDKPEAGIVVGAHMDTLTANNLGKKPGADDDGTGTVTVLELARTLLASKVRFQRPIHLIWYAAEERGLLGSKAVVSHFTQQHIPVSNVLQLDMTGYLNKGDEKTIWFISDSVNSNLTEFVGELAQTYAGVDTIRKTRCGYACSDHASWTKKGFASVMPSEAKFDRMNPTIHGPNDLMQEISKAHMKKYAMLAVAFVAELAEPIA